MLSSITGGIDEPSCPAGRPERRASGWKPRPTARRCIPDELAFPAGVTEVDVVREGDALVLKPVPPRNRRAGTSSSTARRSGMTSWWIATRANSRSASLWIDRLPAGHRHLRPHPAPEVRECRLDHAAGDLFMSTVTLAELIRPEITPTRSGGTGDRGTCWTDDHPPVRRRGCFRLCRHSPRPRTGRHADRSQRHAHRCAGASAGSSWSRQSPGVRPGARPHRRDLARLLTPRRPPPRVFSST